MKTRLLSLALTLVVAVGILPGCTANQQAQAVTTTSTATTEASAAVDALPPAFVAKVKALVAKHPGAEKYLVAFASGLQKTSGVVSRLPAPETLDMYLLWTAFDPSLSNYASEFETIYAEFYPALTGVNNVLGKVAKVVAPQ